MKKKLKCLLFLAALAITAVLIIKSEDISFDPVTVQKLLAGDRIASDRFGYSVALSGDTAVVGAVGAASGKGAAYVYTRPEDGKWSLQQKLTADEVGFGYSVAVDEDTAVIGAADDDDKGSKSGGAAYVFTRSRGMWSLQQKLTAADRAEYDQFGCSVALSKDTAVIGAEGDDSEKGAVYIFTRFGGVWSQRQKLTAAEGAAYDKFGHSVALSGNTAVVGAYHDDYKGSLSGSAYIFTYSGRVWSLQQRLADDKEGANNYFGVSVSVDGDTAVIGALSYGSGAASVFTRTGSVWSLQDTLIADDGFSDDFFGISVSLSRDTAVVGGANDDSKGAFSVFTRTGGVWSHQQKLTAADGNANDNFGYSVAVNGDTTIIGAYGDNSESGSAYAFTRRQSALRKWLTRLLRRLPVDTSKKNLLDLIATISHQMLTKNE